MSKTALLAGIDSLDVEGQRRRSSAFEPSDRNRFRNSFLTRSAA
jgi:hypothetical protein